MRTLAVGSSERRGDLRDSPPSCLWLIGWTDIPNIFIINNYKCLLFKSTKDVPRGDFVVVGGKTLKNAV